MNKSQFFRGWKLYWAMGEKKSVNAILLFSGIFIINSFSNPVVGWFNGSMWHKTKMLKKVALSGLEPTCAIVRNFANQVASVLQVHKRILCASLPPSKPAPESTAVYLPGSHSTKDQFRKPEWRLGPKGPMLRKCMHVTSSEEHSSFLVFFFYQFSRMSIL